MKLAAITADPGNSLYRYCEENVIGCHQFPALDLNVSLTISQNLCAGYRISGKELERLRIRFLACVKNASIIGDSISGLSCNLQAFTSDLFNDL
jgi:hypothetical protein